MSSRSVSPEISAEEFESFLSLLGGESGFPQTYGEWIEYRQKNDEGRNVSSIEVGAQEFSTYCDACGLPPSRTLLDAFIAVKARRLSQT